MPVIKAFFIHENFGKSSIVEVSGQPHALSYGLPGRKCARNSF
jgi:hypothetical protein